MKLKDNKNIAVSVSAGYSSVMMAIKIREWFPDHNIVYAMANTSKERIESLEFMRECDEYFSLNLKWIEADINQENGKGTTYNLKDYKDLSLNGEIFEEGIKKYGIPSAVNKWCNRDLKITPLTKFFDDFFGKGNYSVAVGIRADEIDRVRKDYRQNNIFYPLLDKGITSRDRNKFWDSQPIKIKIPAFKGNCDLCYKKSKRKLLTIIKEDPKTIEWWYMMTQKYSKIEIEGKNAYNSYASNEGMNFYRENMSIQDLVNEAKKPFRSATDEYYYENDLFDFEDECGSSCSAF